VKHLDYLQEQSAELRLEESLIGDLTHPHAENYLMILNYMDLKHLLLLSMIGYTEEECLHIGKLKSNGNVKSFQEMKRLMKSVSGTMATLEPSSF
jgi:hypothetical protein